jgi:hypothetical protein
MIAGGTEAAITPMGVGGFAAMRALSTRNDTPEKASRPWDSGRDGFVMLGSPPYSVDCPAHIWAEKASGDRQGFGRRNSSLSERNWERQTGLAPKNETTG